MDANEWNWIRLIQTSGSLMVGIKNGVGRWFQKKEGKYERLLTAYTYIYLLSYTFTKKQKNNNKKTK